MDWEALGAVSDVIAAAAVVASLLYVALQVRQNTHAIRAAGVEASVNNANAVRQSIYESPETTRIYMLGLKQFEALTDQERERFRLMMHNALWAIWNTWAQHSHTGLVRDVWTAQLPLIHRFLSLPGGQWFWEQYKSEFEKSFRDEVDSVLRQPAVVPTEH